MEQESTTQITVHRTKAIAKRKPSSRIILLLLLLVLFSQSCSECCEDVFEKENQLTDNTIQGEYSVELHFLNVDSIPKWYTSATACINEERKVIINLRDTLENVPENCSKILGDVTNEGEFIGSFGDSLQIIQLSAVKFVQEEYFQRITGYFDLESPIGADSLGFIKFEMNKN